jgi:phasin
VARPAPRLSDFQFRLKGRIPVSEASTNETNANPKAGADENRRFGMPFFAVPEFFDGIAEQNMTRAKENYERMQNASGRITDIFRETYATNAKGAADYTAKVVEFSGANTNSACDFLSQLLGTKSPSEVLQLSAAQGAKNFQTAAAQSRELWELARDVATQTADPIRKSFASVLQKAA